MNDIAKRPDTQRTSTPDSGVKTVTGQDKDRDMRVALRTVYQRTVEEAIPSEMLDLLGKLD